MVLSTVVGEAERDRTLSTQLVVGVLGDGQLVVHDVDVEGGTCVRGTKVCSAGGPGVDLAGWSLLVGLVADVGTGGVRHIAKELGVRTKSFGQDVVVAVVFGEARHAVGALGVADLRSVVHVDHRVGDVVRVAQSVAVDNLEGEHHVAELVGEWRNRDVLSVLGPVNEDVVKGNQGSLVNGPRQVGFFVLHVVSQVGQAEGEGIGVLVPAEVNQSVADAGSFRVDDWTSTLDVNRALDVGRVAGSCHVAVVEDDVGGHRDVLDGCPVEGTVCCGLDHQVVVLLTGGGGAALVGLVHQNLGRQSAVSEVAVGQLNGHELREVLERRGTVHGLRWVNNAHVGRGFSLDDSENVDLVGHAADAAPWHTELSQ